MLMDYNRWRNFDFVILGGGTKGVFAFSAPPQVKNYL
jgi:hypothetical protein